jgi:hypothetical protein
MMNYAWRFLYVMGYSYLHSALNIIWQLATMSSCSNPPFTRHLCGGMCRLLYKLCCMHFVLTHWSCSTVPHSLPLPHSNGRRSTEGNNPVSRIQNTFLRENSCTAVEIFIFVTWECLVNKFFSNVSSRLHFERRNYIVEWFCLCCCLLLCVPRIVAWVNSLISFASVGKL